MKKQSITFTIAGLLSLIWSSNVLALGVGESTNAIAQDTAPVTSPVSAAADDEGLPWFTGPLLAGSGNTIPPGHFNIEPYFTYTKVYGAFDANRKAVDSAKDFYSFSPFVVLSVGLTSFMDIQAVLPYVYNRFDGQSNSSIGDTNLSLGFQLLKGVADTWRPSIRAVVNETFPTGNFENLNANKNGTDATGNGAYQTSVGLNFQQLWHVGDNHYFRDRLALGYTFPATSRVEGVNSFGGSAETSGKVKSGNQFSADVAMEYTVTKHWVPALDIQYTTNTSSNFNGVAGTTPAGLPAIANGPSGDALSLAPAIEYNINSNLGIIAGPWFSVAGRNSGQFTSAMLAINYFH